MKRLLLTSTASAALAVLGWANFPRERLPETAKATRVVVEKSARTLTLYAGDNVLKTYRVALGRNPEGAKKQEGDMRTPEGLYTIAARNARSGYHRALRVSYPSPTDLASARSRGVSAGGDIMVHGIRNRLGWLGKLHRAFDWTSGCVAVTNAEIEEIWATVPDGTPIEIKA